MHKVTSMEAHRVLTVLDDTLERLAYVGHLPLETEALRSTALSQTLQTGGAERVSLALHKLFAAEASASTPFAGGPETDETAAVVRAFCRSVRDAPAAADAIFEAHERCAATAELINQLSQLKSVFFGRMSTTIEEETTNQELLHDLDEKVQRAERQRERLQQALDTMRAERDQELGVFDQTLRKLTAEKDELSDANRTELGAIEKEMTETIEKSTSDHSTEQKQLEEKVRKLRARLAEASDEHRDLENTQRRLMARKEKELSEVIATYDDAMTAKLAEIEDLEERMSQEKTEFLQLEEHFDGVDANMARKAEEEKVIRDLMEREAMARAILADNAAIIQTLVRVRQTRAEFLKAMAKKGKKKGKGKGGKKKKR